MLHVLPHSWSQAQDTWLQEAHFIKHREAKGAQKSSLAHQAKGHAKGEGPYRGVLPAHERCPGHREGTGHSG